MLNVKHYNESVDAPKAGESARTGFVIKTSEQYRHVSGHNDPSLFARGKSGGELCKCAKFPSDQNHRLYVREIVSEKATLSKNRAIVPTI